MRRRSLRSTLLAWNAGVVVTLLAAFGAGIVSFTQYRLRAEIDNDLMRQAERGARLGPPPEGPPPRRFEQPSTIPESFRPLYADSERLSDIRRPRFFLTEDPGPPGGRPDEVDPFGFGPDGPPEGQRGGPGRGRPIRQDPPVDKAALDAALAGKGGFRVSQWQGESVRTYSVPIWRRGRIVGAVQIARELRVLDNLGRIQAGTLLLCLPFAALAAGAAAVTLANRALRPVAAVTRAASQIGSEDLARRLEVPGDDELAELAQTFNGMLARLQTAFTDIGQANERLRQTLESQRRFTADASHELRTPLTRLRMAAGVGKQPEANEAALRDALRVAERAGTVMTRLVEQLLTLARVDAGQLPLRPEALDVRVTVADALDVVPAAHRVEAAFPDHAVPLTADPDHLRRVVINLLENALRHTPEGKRVRIAVSDDADYVTIQVQDEGEGVAAEHLPHLFDRFYRVDDAREQNVGGSGLGLAICRDLVRAHGGELTLESKLGVGTRATVCLPKRIISRQMESS